MRSFSSNSEVAATYCEALAATAKQLQHTGKTWQQWINNLNKMRSLSSSSKLAATYYQASAAEEK